MNSPARTRRTTADLVPFREAVRAWFAISLQTFGGPAGQIAVMERELVERRRWIGHERFLHALSYCTLLPGPEAQQLAVYVGWLLNGIRGGLVAGTLFVLPGMVALLALSISYVVAGDTPVVSAMFAAVAPVVLVVVAQALVRVGRRALARPALVGVAVAAFVALTVVGAPFPLVVALAGVAGWVIGRWAPPSGPPAPPPATTDEDEDDRGAADPDAPVVADDAYHHAEPSRAHALRVLAVGLLAWALPMGAVALLVGGDGTLLDQGLFFSGTALVTFGGAYAVLAYVAQRAVEVYGWLAPGEMVRGLALAESTPGPLIMVVQFVAFLGAYRDPGALSPLAAGIVASLLTTWVVFVPSFVFVFLGAPWVERLRGNSTVTSALTGVTAAVVGVIANLGLYFAVHTLFDRTRRVGTVDIGVELPVVASVDLTAVGVTVAATVVLTRLRWSVPRTLVVFAVVGAVVGAVR